MEKLLGHYKRIADWLACAGSIGAGLILIRLLMAYELRHSRFWQIARQQLVR